MTQIRPMEEREAERVRDLWLQMSAEAGTPLPDASSQLINPARKTPGFSYGDIRAAPCLGLGTWGYLLDT